jgi:hypothetical protein
MSDELLILHCSPTLAGIKTGNLFSCRVNSRDELNRDIRRVNKKLVPKGLRLIPFRCEGGRALLYLYRPERLARDLQDEYAGRILDREMYPDDTPERRIAELSRRLKADRIFPHEIGLFLGYPPEDVDGFIKNRAGGYKCIGFWKVYGDETRAKQRFNAFAECTACYRRRIRLGTALEQLAVTERTRDRSLADQN